MITQHEMVELFEYRDGGLYWRYRPHNGAFNGKRAGTVVRKGYRQIRIFGTKQYEHRLIYLMHYGEIPAFIDHVDGDKANNRIENLRSCTRSENGRNTKPSKRNTSGLKGVHFQKASGKYQAYICVDKRLRHLGYFENSDDAGKAYDEAAIKLFGRFALTNAMLSEAS